MLHQTIHRRGWTRAFQDLPREHGFEPLHVTGTIPADLRGTLYRCGPALFSRFGQPYQHWFDGDGAVTAVRLGDGRAEGAVKIVDSRHRADERAAGRALYGGFGSRVPGGFMGRRQGWKLKATANTNVFWLEGQLFAADDGSRPVRLDAESLASVGGSVLDGLRCRTFTAHPRQGRDGATYGLGLDFGLKSSIHVYRFRGGRQTLLTSVACPRTPFIHDFAVTDRHLVFFIPPLSFNLRFLVGMGTPAENLTWRPGEGAEVVVVPLDDPARVTRFPVDSFFGFHVMNAFERDGEIIVDLTHYAKLDVTSASLAALRAGQPPFVDARPGLRRCAIDPVRRRMRTSTLVDGSCEFPTIAPAHAATDLRHAYVVELDARPGRRFTRIAKVDLEQGTSTPFALADDQFPMEATFVPRPDARGEDDGWVLTLVYDAARHRSFVAVFDAQRPGEEPVGEAWFDHFIPFQLHGHWRPAA